MLTQFHKKGCTCPNQKLLQNDPSEQIFHALSSPYYDSNVFSQTKSGGTSLKTQNTFLVNLSYIFSLKTANQNISLIYFLFVFHLQFLQLKM